MLIVFLSINCRANTYWVSKTGNDSNDCLTQTTAECATIQKALNLAVAGDIIYIKAGTYIETGSCTWFETMASLCAVNSGNSNINRILISSAPNVADGTVVVDSQTTRVGFQVLDRDYLTVRGLKFINNRKHGIVNNAPIAGTPIPQTYNPSAVSVGVIVENCIIDGVTTPDTGDNIGAVSPWNSIDWIIRNNELKNVTTGSGVRAYGVINARVEHNTMSNVLEGVMWKDHFVKNDTTRGFYNESEISYNLIQAIRFGVNIQTRGTGSAEAGHNYIHHNIFYGFTDSAPEGIHYLMSDSGRISGNLKVFNNTFDNSVSAGTCLTFNSTNKMEVKGNIFLRFDLCYESPYVDGGLYPRLFYSDYNVFMGNNSNLVLLDRYSSTSSAFYSTLTNWKAALDSQSLTLVYNNPDTNSSATAYSVGLFIMSNPLRPYIPTGANPAINKMPDNTNAGAYQVGNEIIGRLDPTTYKQPPKKPVIN